MVREHNHWPDDAKHTTVKIIFLKDYNISTLLFLKLSYQCKLLPCPSRIRWCTTFKQQCMKQHNLKQPLLSLQMRMFAPSRDKSKPLAKTQISSTYSCAATIISALEKSVSNTHLIVAIVVHLLQGTFAAHKL
ncbi:hypothetical protein Tcan_13386 [Toxocara canis]|uniref:Uncharacterized protein n=1 Tax=Toxocara canis TaxID=6265 RepID=A0A0B2UW49_TOXCA|nr:hypothetical protein Tcan_13386 [Toxocara canis]